MSGCCSFSAIPHRNKPVVMIDAFTFVLLSIRWFVKNKWIYSTIYLIILTQFDYMSMNFDSINRVIEKNCPFNIGDRVNVQNNSIREFLIISYEMEKYPIENLKCLFIFGDVSPDASCLKSKY